MEGIIIALVCGIMLGIGIAYFKNLVLLFRKQPVVAVISVLVAISIYFVPFAVLQSLLYLSLFCIVMGIGNYYRLRE